MGGDATRSYLKRLREIAELSGVNFEIMLSEMLTEMSSEVLPSCAEAGTEDKPPDTPVNQDPPEKTASVVGEPPSAVGQQAQPAASCAYYLIWEKTLLKACLWFSLHKINKRYLQGPRVVRREPPLCKQVYRRLSRRLRIKKKEIATLKDWVDTIKEERDFLRERLKEALASPIESSGAKKAKKKKSQPKKAKKMGKKLRVKTPDDSIRRYNMVLEKIKKNHISKAEAYARLGVDRNTIVSQAPIAELAATNPDLFCTLRSTFKRKESLKREILLLFLFEIMGYEVMIWYMRTQYSNFMGYEVKELGMRTQSCLFIVCVIVMGYEVMIWYMRTQYSNFMGYEVMIWYMRTQYSNLSSSAPNFDYRAESACVYSCTFYRVSSSALNFDYRAESACVYSRTFNRVSSSALNFDYRAESACVYSRTFNRVSSSAFNFDYRAESACVYSRTFNRVSSSAFNFDYRAESACVYSRTFNRGSSSALNFDYRAESACVYSHTFNRGSSSALNFDYRAESACLLTYLQQRVFISP
ncbi:coiled-coil domain-containing protein 106-like [Labeo rohita]|uniref:Coiled-coil domain-containing protein 106-like n=1 Tax=Labeo rohita TaxID=84645 RepID=A0A498LZU3_LABRO|nr:coiled-coil domain-containing protein 106-like [Labeo rohita]